MHAHSKEYLLSVIFALIPFSRLLEHLYLYVQESFLNLVVLFYLVLLHVEPGVQFQRGLRGASHG